VTRKADKPEGEVRLTLRVSQTSVKHLEELQSWTDAASNSEVFRNALRLYYALIKASRLGHKVYIQEADDEKKRMALFIDAGSETSH
jgi:hypothetical protein